MEIGVDRVVFAPDRSAFDPAAAPGDPFADVLEEADAAVVAGLHGGPRGRTGGPNS